MSKSLSLLRLAGHVRLISGAQRAFTSSACRRDHFLNADKAVSLFRSRIMSNIDDADGHTNLRKTFMKVIEERSKDRLVLADFYAEYVCHLFLEAE